ncbi:MAG: DUF2442 domain-containing protein [Alistipes sp.]|nr:DUF2442 domain-containing protein [Alistipes sp.]
MVQIEKIWLTDTAVWVQTADGRKACENFEEYPRLKHATQQQRENYETDAFGIHWPELDEDLSFEGFFRKRKETALYKLFIAHPELNAAAIARRLGMGQSLLAHYINGTKKLTPEREKLILTEIKKIGQELATII